MAIVVVDVTFWMWEFCYMKTFNLLYRLAEENADAILDAKPKKEKNRKGDEIEETVTKSEF